MTVASLQNVDILTEVEMVALGRRLGACLAKGTVVFLQGKLGAGKTTFARGVLLAFGYSGPVKSPTYTLVEPYESNGQRIYHFDLYRLNDPEELEYMGIREYFGADSICLVEWPERGEAILPDADLIVDIQSNGAGRRVSLQAMSRIGENSLEHIKGES